MADEKESAACRADSHAVTMERSSGLVIGGVMLALVAGGMFVFFLMHGRAREEAITIVGQQRPSVAAVATKPAATIRVETPTEVVVHVVGAVRKPGVYHFKP